MNKKHLTNKLIIRFHHILVNYFLKQLVRRRYFIIFTKSNIH